MYLSLIFIAVYTTIDIVTICVIAFIILSKLLFIIVFQDRCVECVEVGGRGGGCCIVDDVDDIDDIDNDVDDVDEDVDDVDDDGVDDVDDIDDDADDVIGVSKPLPLVENAFCIRLHL